ncbi:MAG: hypothetical protein QOH32_554 [Bradyrhizobium sp.]|jgi:hypothetical protein|nr:hypothetical protein [Bradyrhizobium sp.]
MQRRKNDGGDSANVCYNKHTVIPGRAEREPGIHNHDWGLWIPGLRQGAHPGMTKEKGET